MKGKLKIKVDGLHSDITVKMKNAHLDKDTMRKMTAGDVDYICTCCGVSVRNGYSTSNVAFDYEYDNFGSAREAYDFFRKVVGKAMKDLQIGIPGKEVIAEDTVKVGKYSDDKSKKPYKSSSFELTVNDTVHGNVKVYVSINLDNGNSDAVG